MISEQKWWEVLRSASNNCLDREVAEQFFAEVREGLAKASASEPAISPVGWHRPEIDGPPGHDDEAPFPPEK